MKSPWKTISGAFANLAAQAFPFLLVIIVTPILLRSLGREAYGALILFNLVPQIAGQLDLGLSTAATRGFAQYNARADTVRAMRVFREALVLLALWGAVLGTLFFVLRADIAATLKLDVAVRDGFWVYLAAAIGIPLALINAATLVPLRAMERYGRVAQFQVLAGLAYWGACAVWAVRGATVTQLVGLSTVVTAATAAALFWTATRPAARHAHRPNIVDEVAAEPAERFLLGRFVAVGSSAFIAQASSLATYHADKLIVSAIVSPAAAGAYTICTNLANKTLLVIASAATFTFPRATHLHASGNVEGLVETYRKAARFCAALAMAALVPLFGFAHAFLALWLGVPFADEYTVVLRLLAVGYAVSATSVVASNVTMGIGRGRISAAFAMLGGVTTIAFLSVLTPKYGVAGAAAASLVGMSQALLFNALVARGFGPEAARSSWVLVPQLVLVGAPIMAVLAQVAPLLHSWSLFLPAAAAGAMLFPLAWCLTFGRQEWLFIGRVAAVARRRTEEPPASRPRIPRSHR